MDYFFLKLLEDLFSSPPSSSPELEQNVNVKDVVSGNSLLHICAAKNMVSQVSLLLSLQADPNVTNNNGEIPLHWAVKLNSLRSAVLLIDSRSDVNAVDSSGSSPLHLASENGLPEMVAVLILSPGTIF
jgi:ankyrin repeat protein